MEVDRLDRIARQEMDRVERLGQAQQVLVVGPVADPPAAVEVGDVGRAADGPERDPVAAQLDVVRRVPGVERELRRRRLDQLGDHRPGRTAPAASRARRSGPGRTQDLARVGVEEVHADLGQDAQRADVDRLQLVGRQELGRAVAHPRLGPRRLLRQRRCGHGPHGRRRDGAGAPRPRPCPCPSRRSPWVSVGPRPSARGRPPAQL